MPWAHAGIAARDASAGGREAGRKAQGEVRSKGFRRGRRGLRRLRHRVQQAARDTLPETEVRCAGFLPGWPAKARAWFFSHAENKTDGGGAVPEYRRALSEMKRGMRPGHNFHRATPDSGAGQLRDDKADHQF